MSASLLLTDLIWPGILEDTKADALIYLIHAFLCVPSILIVHKGKAKFLLPSTLPYPHLQCWKYFKYQTHMPDWENGSSVMYMHRIDLYGPYLCICFLFLSKGKKGGAQRQRRMKKI